MIGRRRQAFLGKVRRTSEPDTGTDRDEDRLLHRQMTSCSARQTWYWPNPNPLSERLPGLENAECASR